MKLGHLFSLFPTFSSAEKFQDFEVTGVFNDARQVIPGSVFVAIPGTVVDGHTFISDAIQKGAVALVVQDRTRVPQDFSGALLEVANTREALDLIASRFYRDPGEELFCVGVTGTNGKTSVT